MEVAIFYISFLLSYGACSVVTSALRFSTGTTVISTFNDKGVACKYFTQILSAVTEPEEKRKIIGDTFMKVADEILYELNLESSEVFLAQGVWVGVDPVCVPIELLSTYFNLPQPSVVLVQCVSP